MKQAKQKSYALRIEGHLVEPLQKLKKQNRRSMNAEINAALEAWVSSNPVSGKEAKAKPSGAAAAAKAKASGATGAAPKPKQRGSTAAAKAKPGDSTAAAETAVAPKASKQTKKKEAVAAT